MVVHEIQLEIKIDQQIQVTTIIQNFPNFLKELKNLFMARTKRISLEILLLCFALSRRKIRRQNGGATNGNPAKKVNFIIIRCLEDRKRDCLT